MSDPNMDAADAYTNRQADAFADFQAWMDARDPEQQDETPLHELAETYGDECESGKWVPHAKEES